MTGPNPKPRPAPAVWGFLLAAGLVLCLHLPAEAQPAPDFALKDVVAGQKYTLSQFRGKVVLLNFFTFLCAPCREEMPHLSQMDRELSSRGFQTLGIGLASDPAQLRSLAGQLGLGYPVLAGTKEVSEAYGKVEVVPTTFIIDRQGNITHKIIGARSKDEFLKLIRPLL